MRPTVAEVVLVGERVAGVAEHLVEACIRLERALVALVNVELGQEVRASVRVTEGEVVQMRVGPPHHLLHRIMDLAEVEVAWDRAAAPDLGPGAPE